MHTVISSIGAPQHPELDDFRIGTHGAEFNRADARWALPLEKSAATLGDRPPLRKAFPMA
jgi:hypothetical protein